MIDPGRMIEQVAFDSPTSEQDGYGGVIEGWTEEFTTRAVFRYLRGGEAVQAARLQGRQPLVSIVRATPDTRRIGTDWRMRDVRSGAAYNVRACVLTDDRHYVEITAEGGVVA